MGMGYLKFGGGLQECFGVVLHPLEKRSYCNVKSLIVLSMGTFGLLTSRRFIN
jgi:hypothetical protein